MLCSSWRPSELSCRSTAARPHEHTRLGKRSPRPSGAPSAASAPAGQVLSSLLPHPDAPWYPKALRGAQRAPQGTEQRNLEITHLFPFTTPRKKTHHPGRALFKYSRWTCSDHVFNDYLFISWFYLPYQPKPHINSLLIKTAKDMNKQFTMKRLKEKNSTV